MKKRLISFFTAFSFAMSLFAIGISPRAVSVSCPRCDRMATVNTTKTLMSQDSVSCIHGKSGTDLLKTYRYVDTTRCNSCNYYGTSTYYNTERICNGH